MCGRETHVASLARVAVVPSFFMHHVYGSSSLVSAILPCGEGGRMTVAKLSDGSLWVHSPVELDEPLREALGELGPVAHIVSPNYEHVK